MSGVRRRDKTNTCGYIQLHIFFNHCGYQCIKVISGVSASASYAILHTQVDEVNMCF